MMEFIFFYLFFAYGLGFRLQTFLIHGWWWDEFGYENWEDASIGFLWFIVPLTLPFVLLVELVRWTICYPFWYLFRFMGRNAKETHIV